MQHRCEPTIHGRQSMEATLAEMEEQQTTVDVRIQLGCVPQPAHAQFGDDAQTS